ncbi:MAG: hydratase [Ideonella sp.]|nr:hydratase [Ideonella sp.]
MTPHALLQHFDTGEPWPGGPGASGCSDLAAAYQAALAVRALRIARGEQARGFKIGFTNRTIWQRYQVFAPIWGTVWDTSLGPAGDTPAPIEMTALCQPRIEPEVVFGMRATPAPDADLDALFDALDWIAPGFELVQSHQPGWKFSAPDTVADAGLHARLRVGEHVPVRALAANAAALDALLAATSLTLERDNAAVEQGLGANVLDSPLRALLHFLTELRQCPGAPDLQAGDVVTTGTWTDAWPVRAGERWTSRFSAHLPSISVDFVQAGILRAHPQPDGLV